MMVPMTKGLPRGYVVCDVKGGMDNPCLRLGGLFNKLMDCDTFDGDIWTMMVGLDGFVHCDRVFGMD